MLGEITIVSSGDGVELWMFTCVCLCVYVRVDNIELTLLHAWKSG